MTRVPTRKTSTSSIELKPLGSGGLNLSTDPVVVAENALVLARNVTEFDGVGRRLGSRKIAKFNVGGELAEVGYDYGAKVFGSATKYAYFSPPNIAAGGFAIGIALRALRTGSINWAFDSGESGYAHRVMSLALLTDGTLQFNIEWQDAGTSYIVSDVIPDDAEVRVMAVFDPKAGTLTLYVDGEVSGTPVTGIVPDARPYQGTAPWYIGCSYDPGGGVFPDSSFAGAIDDFWCISLAGVDITDEDLTVNPPRRSMLHELRKRSRQEWSCATSGMLLWYFSMDEETTELAWTPGLGTMYDFSERAAHGVYVGAPTNDTRVVYRSQNGQNIGTVRRAAVGDLRDGRVNLALVGGATYYEILNEGT